MIKLTETYTQQQAIVNSKLDELLVELEVVSFTIEKVSGDIYFLSQHAAIEGMKVFDQRIADNWLARRKELLNKCPEFDVEKRFKIKIYDNKPIGKITSFEEFVGFDYQNQTVNIHDYRGCDLAHALLDPPYGIKVKIDAKYGSEEYYKIKTKEFTNLYRMFLNDFIMLSEYNKEDLIIYSWSDDWSSFFDEGKGRWGTYYWTVYNKQNNTIIVLGASETD